jgi:predicted nucleic acid-binding protein
LVAEHRRAGTGVVSLQVLHEYFATVTRKLVVDARIVRRKVELLAEFDVAAPDVTDILAAIDLHRLHGFSFWDALVQRAAKQSVCSVLLSEDFRESREVDGVRVVNPFLTRVGDQQHFPIWLTPAASTPYISIQALRCAG